jgi:8-oxo-dGTP pyrophosphatase MutT (NUDIX family)
MSFRVHFIELLTKQLPGEIAHIPLLPSGRKVSSEVRHRAINPIASAVAIHLVIEETNDVSIVLIERSKYSGAHSGQIAFPGGKVETDDNDLLYTARRESEEEIGLSKPIGEYIGKLTPVYIPISNFDVYPFVILHEKLPELIANEREVEGIIISSLSSFTAQNAIQYREVELVKGNKPTKVPGFTIGDKWLWGATALIVNELATIYSSAHERFKKNDIYMKRE